jgi:hypothetical protein
MHTRLTPILLAALLLAGAAGNASAKQNHDSHPRPMSTATPSTDSTATASPAITPTPTGKTPVAVATPTAVARVSATATPAAFVSPTPSPTQIAPAGKLRYRAVDVMKLSKDVINDQPSDDRIVSVVAAAKSMSVTHVAFSTPLDSNSDFLVYGNNPSPRTIESFTLAWASAIHNAGLHVLFRGTLSAFEQGGASPACGTSGHTVVGIYKFPFYVTGQCSVGNGAGGLQPQAWWVNKLQSRLTALAQIGVFQPGDIIAPLPEPQSNHNFWDSAWNFLAMNNQPSLYASFFDSAKQAEDASLAAAGVAGVQTGFTSDNGSMFLSGPGSAGGGTWVPVSYEQAVGILNMDHYGSDGCGGYAHFSPQEMLCGLQDIYSHYQTPIFHQEWSDINGSGPRYVQGMLDSAFLPEIQAGAYIGLNYWDPGCGNPGSLFNCDYTLTPTGQVLQAWFAGVS